MRNHLFDVDKPTLGKKILLYHITATENLASILREGLRGGTRPRNRGQRLKVPAIFTLTTKARNVTDRVAINQIWPDEDIGDYAVIRIVPKGVSGPVLPDEVAESTATLHRIVEQEAVSPRFLKLSHVVPLNFPGGRLSDLRDTALFQRKLTAEEWALARSYFPPALLRMQRSWEAGQ